MNDNLVNDYVSHDLLGKNRGKKTSSKGSEAKDEDEDWDEVEKKGITHRRKRVVKLQGKSKSTSEADDLPPPYMGSSPDTYEKMSQRLRRANPDVFGVYIEPEEEKKSTKEKKVQEKKSEKEKKVEENKVEEKKAKKEKKVEEKKVEENKSKNGKKGANQKIKVDVTDDSKDQEKEAKDEVDNKRPLRSNTIIKSKGVEITHVEPGFLDFEVHLPATYAVHQDCLPVKKRPTPTASFMIPIVFWLEPNWSLVLSQMESCRNWEELKQLCMSDECNWLELPPAKTFPLMRLDTDPECFVTRNIIPDDVKFETSQEKPFACRTKPDGNCFFHSISRQVFGHGKCALQLRARCVKEAVLNENRYMSHDYLIQDHPFFHEDTHFAASIIRQTNHYKGFKRKIVPDLNDEETIQEAYREEVMLLRKNGKWAGIWQFFQMVHVLMCPIYSHYPKVAETHALLRHDYNRLFCIDINCAQDDEANPLHIMWTRGDESSTDFNHFVSLVP